MEPRELTIAEARDLLAGAKLSAVELLASVLEQIDRVDQEANAYITVRHATDLLDEARRADERLRKGAPRRPLEGIPVSLKDNFATAGIRTTAGSKILAEWVPDRSATVVRKLEEAGAVIVGKLNMHEFANGPTNENPHFGRPLNPWDATCTPGGSSGGSAVALANDMCLGAMGTDTGGSIRTPACFCGVVGLKPTFGLVSRAGVFPFSWSLDHAGPMARTSHDVAILLQAITGHDPGDPGSARASFGGLPNETDISGLVVGIETSYLTALMENEIRRSFDRAIELLKDLGTVIEEVQVPTLSVSLQVELAILFPEAASIHRQYLDTRPMDYGKDVRRSLLSGRLYSAEAYVEAQRVRAVLCRELTAAFKKIDVLAMPTVVISPPAWGVETFRMEGRDLDMLNAFIRCTAPFNLSGHPALSVPSGLTRAGLPVGLQLVGAPFSEARLLSVGHAFETARGPIRRPSKEASSAAVGSRM